MDFVDFLVKHFRALCEALEEIRDSSSGHSAYDAENNLYVASAIIWHILAYTQLTVALQDKNCDLFKAH